MECEEQLRNTLDGEKAKLETEHSKKVVQLETQSIDLLKAKEAQAQEFGTLKRE